MELEKQKFPWLDAMEFELNHRVVHYLMTEHEAYLEYRGLREEIGALKRKYFYLAGQADMMLYMHTLQRLSKEGTAEGRTFSSEEIQRVSDCLDLEDDKYYIEQTELYLKGIRDGYAF